MGRLLPGRLAEQGLFEPYSSTVASLIAKMESSSRSPASSAETIRLPSTASEARVEASALSNRLGNITELLSVHESTLTQQGVTLTSPLIDKDGFPLAEVDLLAVRTARQEIRRLQNDQAAIQSRLHALLSVALRRDASADGDGARPLRPTRASNGNGTAHAAATSSQLPSSVTSNSSVSSRFTHLEAFARINNVVTNSPADRAGLEAEDLLLCVSKHNDAPIDGIISTDSEENQQQQSQPQIVDATRPNPLASLPPLIAEGETVLFAVRRNAGGGSLQDLELPIIPQSGWGGRGLLG